MTPKRRRLTLVVVGALFLSLATVLVLNAFEENLVFFYSPTELLSRSASSNEFMRVGGLVKDGSLKKSSDGLTTIFEITDLDQTLSVAFKGVLPSLFREGQGVIAEGHLLNGTFHAREILAKHDETYMPREVAAALKKSGKWKQANDK